MCVNKQAKLGAVCANVSWKVREVQAEGSSHAGLCRSSRAAYSMCDKDFYILAIILENPMHSQIKFTIFYGAHPHPS